MTAMDHYVKKMKKKKNFAVFKSWYQLIPIGTKVTTLS